MPYQPGFFQEGYIAARRSGLTRRRGLRLWGTRCVSCDTPQIIRFWVPLMTRSPSGHIRLTSHSSGGKPLAYPIHWGAATARESGPIMRSVFTTANRDVIGAHGGAYSVYRSLAVSSGELNPSIRPDLKDTGP